MSEKNALVEVVLLALSDQEREAAELHAQREGMTLRDYLAVIAKS